MSSRRFAAALLGAATLVATPAFASAQSLDSGSASSDAPTPPAAACTAVATPDAPGGWGVPFEDEQHQVGAISDGIALDDDGALRLAVVSTTDREAFYHGAENLPVADLAGTEIGFIERSTTPVTSFQLRLLDTTGGKFTNGFTTLVWEASNNGGADTADGATHSGLQNGLWWSTQNIDGAKNKVPVTLAEIAAANPAAVVEHYGVSVGRGPATAEAFVDNVVFGGCTTNFAMQAPGTGGGSLGSSGSSDFGSNAGSSSDS